MVVMMMTIHHLSRSFELHWAFFLAAFLLYAIGVLVLCREVQYGYRASAPIDEAIRYSDSSIDSCMRDE